MGRGHGGGAAIIGTMTIHQDFERQIAKFKGTEAALSFQSGFTVNVACCQSLMSDAKDLLISDELNHASIIDGGAFRRR